MFPTKLVPLLSLALLITESHSKTKCVKASGKLRCRPDPTKVADVQIKMLDWDGLPWEHDDQMGLAWSEEDGSFVISGCGYDLGAWNSPDPYLKIRHFCLSDEGGDLQLGIWPTFLPDELDVGTIDLDSGK